MSEPTAQTQHLWLPKGALVALAVLSAYFGLAIVPEWWPGFAGTETFFFYVLSIPLALIGLLGLTIWGIAGVIVARRRGSSPSQLHRGLVVVSLAGFLMFASAIGLTRAIRGALPTGSHLLEFDPGVWQDPNSSQFIQGDITPRQKMLGSLVERLGTSLTRAELEALLGPSLDTPYFESTGRDLIYMLGPERDSFIRIDSEWLLIWLDDTDHFDRYGIYTD